MRDDSNIHFRPFVSNYDRGKCITLELYLTFKLLAGEDAVFHFEFSFALICSFLVIGNINNPSREIINSTLGMPIHRWLIGSTLFRTCIKLKSKQRKRERERERERESGAFQSPRFLQMRSEMRLCLFLHK